MMYLNSHLPRASKSDKMKASSSFMVSNFYFTFFISLSLLISNLLICGSD